MLNHDCELLATAMRGLGVRALVHSLKWLGERWLLRLLLLAQCVLLDLQELPTSWLVHITARSPLRELISRFG